ncbi:helix-turn-helix domain-containing protein [Pseudomonas sp. CT11-2]|jgi:predicted XRE-type DNA-binding protein|uniref:helix-turn-helix domain-containing protein n=1 Tax=unclassified Pseudomonas TaxID=196821 RepID=UPI00215EA367|nr:helix-turn-helix domain-containing protein [Pseudomonas sp. B21-019]UVM34348.1 helix-turn-helix domain-containing protein [Pseudomonas sp. B21-019]
MIEIEESSGNAYEDLGMDNAIAMSTKSKLATEMGEVIKARQLTHVQASEIMGLSQATLSEMLRGSFRDIGETRMVECLSMLRRDIPDQ